MSLIIVRCYGKDEEEYMQFVQEKNKSAWTTYTDITRSFVRVRVEKRGKHWFLEFLPALPPFHMYLFAATLILWAVGVGLKYLLIPLVIGALISLWWSPIPYMLLMVLGFKIRYKHLPSIWFLSSGTAVRRLLGW